MQVNLDMGLRAPKGSAARRKGLVGVRSFTMPEAEGEEEPLVWANAQVGAKRTVSRYRV
jgi:hypothetical protein